MIMDTETGQEHRLTNYSLNLVTERLTKFNKKATKLGFPIATIDSHGTEFEVVPGSQTEINPEGTLRQVHIVSINYPDDPIGE